MSKRRTDVKRIMPKVKMIHKYGSLAYIIQVGHSLEAIEDGTTLWTIHSGYEGSSLRGRRPKILKFFEAIPSMEVMLRK